jgi:hypothetical protein
MKMYFAVLDEVPSHMVPVLVAHAAVGAHIHIQRNAMPEYFQLHNAWLRDSFRKVVVKVNRKEFDKIAALPEVYLAHEITTLGGSKSCAVILVNEEIPNVIKFAKLWSPNESN